MAEATPSPKRQRLALVPSEPDAGEGELMPNVDLIDYFAQRGGRVSELERESAALSQRNRQLENDLRVALAEVESMKETARMRAQTDRALVESYKQEREAAEEAYRREMARTMDASARLKKADEAKFAALQRADKAASELAEAQGQARQQQLAAQASLGRLQGELAAAKQDAALARKMGTPPPMPAHAKRTEELQSQLAAAEARAGEEAARRRTAEVAAAEANARCEAAEAALREAQPRLDDSSQEVIAALRSELRAQEAEVARARKLQSRAESLAVAGERLAAAEARAERAEAAQAAGAAAHVRAEEAEAAASAWAAAAGECGAEEPGELRERLAALRAQCLACEAAAGKAEGEARRAREAAAAAEAGKAEAEAALQGVQGANAELTAAAARAERKAALLAKEREGLQRLLASFRTEAAESGGAAAAVPSAETEGLRAQLAAAQAQVTTLEDSLTASASQVKEAREALGNALAQAAAAEAGKARLAGEAERLQAEVAQLQERVDRGEFNPGATRVLHYILNPEAQAQRSAAEQAQQALEAEIARLRAQLAQAGSNGGEGSGSGQDAVLRAEIVVLEQKVAELAKREQRLKDVFQRQVATFREAVYLLFGYRVDMAAEAGAGRAGGGGEATSFVLRPQHASSSREQLLFRLAGGRMALQRSDFTDRKLRREVETFIERFDSIPAFTANWTMELFQRQARD